MGTGMSDRTTPPDFHHGQRTSANAPDRRQLNETSVEIHLLEPTSARVTEQTRLPINPIPPYHDTDRLTIYAH